MPFDVRRSGERTPSSVFAGFVSLQPLCSGAIYCTVALLQLVAGLRAAQLPRVVPPSSESQDQDGEAHAFTRLSLLVMAMMNVVGVAVVRIILFV